MTIVKKILWNIHITQQKDKASQGQSRAGGSGCNPKNSFLLEIDTLCTEHWSSLPFHLLWPVISPLPFLVAWLMIIDSCSLVYNYLSVQLGSVPCSWARIFQRVLYSLNIQSLLKAKQHNTLKSSKITIYFQRTETKEKEPANSNTNEGEVILVDWATFFCTPVNHDCNSHLFTLHHNWFVLYVACLKSLFFYFTSP